MHATGAHIHLTSSETSDQKRVFPRDFDGKSERRAWEGAGPCLPSVGEHRRAAESRGSHSVGRLVDSQRPPRAAVQ